MSTNFSSPEYVESRADFARPTPEAHWSGVAWGAVIGGAFASAAIYLILLALGAGFELSAVSPWSNVGASASAAGVAAIIWLLFSEIAASAMGGYLTGRLRTKWATVHSDEVFFRDTANGFLAWAVALVVSAAFLSSATAAMAGMAPSRSTADPVAAAADPNAYYVDSLFRSNRLTPAGQNLPARAEAARIFGNALRAGDMPQADQNYLAQMVAADTGITLADSEKRVSDAFGNARQAAENARKAAAHLLLWLFLSLLLGALAATYAATIGGRQRDHVRTT